ncbi:MAG: protein-export membrane protein SecD [Candidatus Epulonipiscioides saccharophilum]|nr:MAG: protein-export membrane protein SecD [Epulopiscium sp. AS2M-Bin001]
MKSVLKILGVVLGIIITIYLAYFGIGEKNVFCYSHINLGLDLRGGVSIVYEVDGEVPTASDMAAAVAMIQVRLDKENYTEAEVAIEGDRRIRVNIPGVEDPQEAINSIGATALLTFEDETGKVVLEGKNIKSAVFQLADMGMGNEAVVAIKLDDIGTEAFKIATEENIGKPIIIKLDGHIISAPTVNEAIRNGESVISGSFTEQSASQLADRIEAGSLPFALIPISSSGVGAKLGMDAFNASVEAAIVGFIIVLIFMTCVYRLSGVVADIALTLYVSLMIVVLSLIQATLTLPGIAGIILSIGMAVDANVIIFTRIKEEILSGKSVRSAVDSGFHKALSGIIDGNVTTLIASFVLYMFGSGIIKSFATTLGIGIILSMFTALIVTRILLRAFVASGLQNPVLYGGTKQ